MTVCTSGRQPRAAGPQPLFSERGPHGNRRKNHPDEDHLQHDERRADGRSAQRARCGHRGRQETVRSDAPDVHQRAARDGWQDVRRREPDRHAVDPRTLPERRARAREGGGRGSTGRGPRLGRTALACARGEGAGSGGRDPQSPVGALRDHGLRGWQESPRVRRRRRRVGGLDGVLLRPGRGAQRVRAADGHAQPARAQLQRPAAVRRVGRHLAVQLSARARRRSRRRRARGREHRRVQTGEHYAAGWG